jgi:hypothetical protein
MGDFDFVKCVVENEKVYCTDAEGNIYEMPLPKKISVHECPQCAVTKLLAVRAKRERKDG